MTKVIGIKDIHGATIQEGDKVRITIEGQIHPDQRQTLFEGMIEYRGIDISSLGCGYGVRHDGYFDFLATLSNRCQIEVLK